MIANLDNKLSSLTIMATELADIFEKTINAKEHYEECRHFLVGENGSTSK